jgi:hypothetical protein
MTLHQSQMQRGRSLRGEVPGIGIQCHCIGATSDSVVREEDDARQPGALKRYAAICCAGQVIGNHQDLGHGQVVQAGSSHL